MDVLHINGKEISKNKGAQDKSDIFKTTQVIQVQTLRGAGQEIKIKAENEDDIVDIEFTDGGEWIGSALDFTEIFGEKVSKSRSATATDGTFQIPSSLDGSASRGTSLKNGRCMRLRASATDM